MSEILLELFNKRKKEVDNSKIPVATEQERKKYEVMFNKTVTSLSSITKSVLKGCELNTDDVKITKTEGKKNIKYVYVKEIVSIRKNMEIFKKYSKLDHITEKTFKSRFALIDDMYDFVHDNIFNKLSDFKMNRYTMAYDNTKYENLIVDMDDSCDKMTVTLTVVVGESQKVTESINEPLLELFFKRKKVASLYDEEASFSLPKKAFSKTYDGDQIRKEINDLHNQCNLIIKKYHKNVIGKGIDFLQESDVFYNIHNDDYDRDDYIENNPTYHSGAMFPLFSYDLWDYPGGEARTNRDDDGLHPIDKVEMDICEKLEEYIKTKYKGRYIMESYGDWDDGTFGATLK